MPKAGYMVDMKQDGFGLVPVAYHATAAFADPVTDKLYLVLDEDDEPTSAYLPLPSTEPAAGDLDGGTILEFNDPEGDGHMVYRYRGKLNLLPRPAAFTYAQVRAEEYTNILLRLYGDGDQIFETVITSQEPFTLPMLDEYASFEVEILGTSRVRTFQTAEDISEFD